MSWEMFGYPKGDGEWLYVGDFRSVKMHGCAEPVPVEVIEDSEGNYLGWLDDRDRPEVGGTPKMITRKEIFNVNFPQGYKAAEEAGRGCAIPLTIKEITE